MESDPVPLSKENQVHSVAMMGGQNNTHEDAVVRLRQAIQMEGVSPAMMDPMLLVLRQVPKLRGVPMQAPLLVSSRHEIVDLEHSRVGKPSFQSTFGRLI